MKLLLLIALALPGCAFFDDLNTARDNKPPKVLEDVFELGMTKSEAADAWPARLRDVNKTVGVWGTSTQWVYGVGSGKAYLYFQDGVLVAWQS